jgi:hypothetical protein
LHAEIREEWSRRLQGTQATRGLDDFLHVEHGHGAPSEGRGPPSLPFTATVAKEVDSIDDRLVGWAGGPDRLCSDRKRLSTVPQLVEDLIPRSQQPWEVAVHVEFHLPALRSEGA